MSFLTNSSNLEDLLIILAQLEISKCLFEIEKTFSVKQALVVYRGYIPQFLKYFEILQIKMLMLTLCLIAIKLSSYYYYLQILLVV